MLRVKDSLEYATLHDVRILEATVVAGFQICYEQIAITLSAMENGGQLQPTDIERISRNVRDHFIAQLNEVRDSLVLAPDD